MQKTKLLLKNLADRPIAYQPIYSKITGSVTAGVLLSQLLYWHYAMDEQEFYKTDKDFCDELAMGLYELKNAKKRLKELRLVKIIRKGQPAKTFYSLDIETIISSITSYGKNPQQERGKIHNKTKEKPITINTENKTETNSETTTYNGNASVAGIITNEFIKLFEIVNPSYERIFSNKTERTALNRLIEKWGKEKLENIIKSLEKSNAQPYAPTITKPTELERDLGKLIAWYKKQENIKQTNTKTKKIIGL